MVFLSSLLRLPCCVYAVFRPHTDRRLRAKLSARTSAAGGRLELFEASGRKLAPRSGCAPFLVCLRFTTPLTSSETILSTLQAAMESDYQIKTSAFFSLAREVLFDSLDVPVYLG